MSPSAHLHLHGSATIGLRGAVLLGRCDAKGAALLGCTGLKDLALVLRQDPVLLLCVLLELRGRQRVALLPQVPLEVLPEEGVGGAGLQGAAWASLRGHCPALRGPRCLFPGAGPRSVGAIEGRVLRRPPWTSLWRKRKMIQQKPRCWLMPQSQARTREKEREGRAEEKRRGRGRRGGGGGGGGERRGETGRGGIGERAEGARQEEGGEEGEGF